MGSTVETSMLGDIKLGWQSRWKPRLWSTSHGGRSHSFLSCVHISILFLNFHSLSLVCATLLLIIYVSPPLISNPFPPPLFFLCRESYRQLYVSLCSPLLVQCCNKPFL